MTELVTLAEAKSFLRVDDGGEDATIAMLIGAATEAVLTIADAWTPVEGLPVPERLRLAVLARVAIAFDNRENVTAADGEFALIAPLRVLEI